LLLGGARRRQTNGGVTVPGTRRRPIFNPVREEVEGEFTSRKQMVDTSQLLKRQSEKLLTGRRFMFEI
jgi:hypothetical protein